MIPIKSPLKFNPNTILVLLGTSFGSGFAPLAVIEKMTQQWKTEKEQWKREAGIINDEKKILKKIFFELNQKTEQAEKTAKSIAGKYRENIGKLKEVIRNLSDDNGQR